MIRKVRLDGKEFTHTQSEKLMRYMADKHGFVLEFRVLPMHPVRKHRWICGIPESRVGLPEQYRSGTSLWDCLSQAVVNVCIPAIEEERKGGNP